MGYDIPADHSSAPKAEAAVAEPPKKTGRRWTLSMEDELTNVTRKANELGRLKQQIVAENRNPVEAFVAALATRGFDGDVKITEDGIDDLTCFLIERAEEVRDLLEPFDMRRPRL